MSSSSSLPNINLDIQLHVVEGTHDFRGYVFSSRVSDLDNTHNEHTSEIGENLARSDDIQRCDVKAFIRAGRFHLTIKAKNVSVNHVDDDYQDEVFDDIESDEELPKCATRTCQSSIQQPRIELPIESNLQNRSATSAKAVQVDGVDNEDSESFSATSAQKDAIAYFDNEESETNSYSSEYSQILL